MKPFDLVQSFIERTTGAPSTAQELSRTFRDVIERLGFVHFACFSHVDPLRPPPGAVVLQNYPEAWVREYSDRRLHEIDPVLQRAEVSALPFSWDVCELQHRATEQQQIMLSDARSFGIERGYTVPIHMPWTPGALRASCTVLPDRGSIDRRNHLAIQVMAAYLYIAATQKAEQRTIQVAEKPLTARQKQCLELVAQGKDDWTISQLLRLSENTVHTHLEQAKRRLGVATRIQAVLCALQAQQISLGDAARACPTEKQPAESPSASVDSNSSDSS